MKEIPLTRGKVALVDDDDYGWLSNYKWYAQKGHNTYYAVRGRRAMTNQSHTVYMHREINGTGKQIDHRDGNGLNNQKFNLRECTSQQNQFNKRKARVGKSQYKGVFRYGSGKKWKAQIRHGYKSIHIGCYETQLAAAQAYDAKANELFGDFALPNFE